MDLEDILQMEVRMKKYLASLKIEYLNSKEYFISFVSSIFYIPITIIVYYFLWKFIMKEQADIAGMNFDDVIAYFMTILVVKNSISNTMAETYYIFQDINSGNIDTLITKPIYYPLTRFCISIGRVVISMPLGIAFWIAVQLYFDKFSFASLGYFIISLFLGFCLMFQVLCILGLLTFWLKSVLSLRDIFWYILAIFSGEVVPLAFFSGKFEMIKHNPLAGIYYIPANIINSNNMKALILEQVIYIVIFSIIIYFMWKRGIKHYESQGG